MGAERRILVDFEVTRDTYSGRDPGDRPIAFSDSESRQGSNLKAEVFTKFSYGSTNSVQ